MDTEANTNTNTDTDIDIDIEADLLAGMAEEQQGLDLAAGYGDATAETGDATTGVTTDVTDGAGAAADASSAAGEGAPSAEGGQNAQDGIDTANHGGQGDPQQPAWIAALPEEARQEAMQAMQAAAEAQALRESLAQRERDFHALQGRVAPLQRQLDQYQRQVSDQRPAQPAPANDPPATGQPAPALANAQAQIDQALAMYESQEWQEYEQTFPEEAALQKRQQLAVLEAAKATALQVAALQQQVQPTIQSLQEAQQQAAHQAARQQLEAEHRDWSEINKSNEFWDWYEGQAQLIGFGSEEEERAKLNDPRFVSALLTQFKRTSIYAQAANGAGAPAPAAQQPPSNNRQGGSAVLALAARPSTGGSVAIPRGAAVDPDTADFLAGYRDQLAN